MAFAARIHVYQAPENAIDRIATIVATAGMIALLGAIAFSYWHGGMLQLNDPSWLPFTGG